MNPNPRYTLGIMEQKNMSVRVRVSKYAKLGMAVIAGAVLFLSCHSAPTAPEAQASTSGFLYTFNSDGVLNEAGSMAESTSPYFWLNSGGMLTMKNGLGSTIQGSLPTGQRWQVAYASANPLDTDNGYHPQNLFRLVTKSTWKNVVEEVAFRINAMELSTTPNRDGYSGILLMSRYTGDGQTLYYAGLRQDGTAVIKKKINGVYYTLAQAPVFSGVYNKLTNPNLIPANQWMKLRTETKDLANGDVSVTVYVDKANNGTWTKVLSATDHAGTYGGSAVISGSAYAGIRTDYMDVDFDNYRLTEI